MTNFERFRVVRIAAWAGLLFVLWAWLWTMQRARGDVFGNYALQPGDGRTVSEADLRRPGVDGLTIRFRPQWIGGPQKWDWSFVDASVARCRRTDDDYTLLLMGGATNPLAESNLRYYEAAAAAIGARYGDDARCVGVHVTGGSPAGVSEELHWRGRLSRGVIDANKRLISAWARACPKQTILLATGGSDTAAMLELNAHGLEVCGESRWLVKHNRMKASTQPGAQHNRLVVECGKRGAQVGWEMVGSATKERDRFGGTLAQAYAIMDRLESEAGKPRRQSYRAIYPPDLHLLGGLK